MAIRENAERVLSLHRGQALTTVAQNEVFYDYMCAIVLWDYN